MKMMLVSLAGICLLSCAVVGFAKGEEPFKSTSFESACKEAKRAKKLVLIDFYTTWCGPCKLLDKNTWSNAKVKTWLKTHTVCLKVDAEKSVAFASKYHIDAYPTILLLSATGKEKDRIVGYVSPQDFLSTVKQFLAGKDSLARASDKLASAGKNDPMAREEYARTLAGKGKNKEALAEYLWCYDEGAKADPAFAGVRLSFLLSSIVSLGRSYPEALTALRVRRDKAGAILISPDANIQTVWDFKALNRELHEDERSLTMFDKLSAKKSPLKNDLKDSIVELLLEKKRYLDIIGTEEEMNKAVDSEITNYGVIASFEKDKSQLPGMKPFYVDRIAPYLQACAGAGKQPETQRLMKKILDFDKSPKTYASLLARAKASESDFLKGLLLASAKENLTPKEFDAL